MRSAIYAIDQESNITWNLLPVANIHFMNMVKATEFQYNRINCSYFFFCFVPPNQLYSVRIYFRYRQNERVRPTRLHEMYQLDVEFRV